MKFNVATVGGAFGAGTILIASYYYFIHQMDRNCSLVKQTIHNLNYMEDCKKVTDGHCQPISNIRGEMLQRKGFANIDFDVRCRNGHFTIALTAHRQGMNWRTEHITLYENGQEKLEINMP
jgi:hypothetical protein